MKLIVSMFVLLIFSHHTFGFGDDRDAWELGNIGRTAKSKPKPTYQKPAVKRQTDQRRAPLSTQVRTWKKTKFDKKLDKYSSFSISKANTRKALVITNNDRAFQSKLDIVTNARPGDQLDIMYFIFSDDESSSHLANAIIAAGQRGVRVRILLDYLTNFSRYDYLAAINESSPNIHVRLYNKPTAAIVEDAEFMTMGCKDPLKSSCEAEKEVAIRSGKRGLGQMFLAGIYAKKPEVAALAIYAGHSVADVKGTSGEPTAEDKSNLKKAVKLLYEAKVKGSLIAKLSLLMLGQKIEPLESIFDGILPASRISAHENDWEYITDYIHMKLLARTSSSGQVEMILGGRNVENSYHMRMMSQAAHPFKKRGDKVKYTFMDTDFYVAYSDSSKSAKKRFEKMWNFSSMVATLGEVERLTPYSYILSYNAADKACGKLKGDAYSECFTTKYFQASASLPDSYTRRRAQLSSMQSKASAYTREYDQVLRSTDFPTFEIDLSGEGNFELYYLENVPFGNDEGVRHFGASNSKPEKDGKFIHKVWLDALADVCEDEDRFNKKVNIHNAYLLLPSNLYIRLLDMVSHEGDLDCQGVDLTIVTNSFFSTDLNPINLLNDILLWRIFDHSKRSNEDASLSYFAYTPATLQAARAKKATGLAGLSLHSKVETFGDDMLIASANADVRSFMMDANNGIYIRNAPKLVAAYSEWLEDVLADSDKTADLTRKYQRATAASVKAESRQCLNLLISQYEGSSIMRGYAPRLRTLYSEALDRLEACSAKAVWSISNDNFGANTWAQNEFGRPSPNECDMDYSFNFKLKGF